MSQTDPRLSRLWTWGAPALIVLLTVALRLWNIDHGLPAFEEEALPFRKSFALWGWQGDGWHANPHYFNYPSLTLYLQHMLQWAHFLCGKMTGLFATRADYWLSYIIDPGGHVILARMMGVLADTAAALAVWKLGERWSRGAGLMAGLLTALAPTLIRTGRSVYTDNPMAALVLWSLVMTVTWRETKAPRHLVWAAILAGLAAGAKYPGAVALIPLGQAVWAEYGLRRGWRTWLGATALAAGVFLLTSPYILLDFPAFWHDFSFERAHMAQGHLGATGHMSLFRILDAVRWNLGGLNSVLLIIGLLAPLTRWWSPADRVWRRLGISHPRGETTVLLYAIISLVMLGGFRMFSERYLVTLIPLLALLLAKTVLDLLRHFLPHRLTRLTLPLCLLLLTGPGIQGVKAARSGSLTTRELAQSWIQNNLDDTVLMVQEGYGATVRTFSEQQVTRRHPMFKQASESRQQTYLQQPVFRAVSVPMVASGSMVVHLKDTRGPTRPLVVWPHGIDANASFYFPELYRGVDYFVVSSAMGDRYRQDPERFARQLGLYAWLEQTGSPVATFEPSGDINGPHLTIYDLREQPRQPADFAPLLWLECLPTEFPPQLAARLGQPGQTVAPETWSRVLGEPYTRFLQPFHLKMARNLADLGRTEHALAYAEAIVAMNPRNAPAANLGAWCAHGLGRREQAANLARRCLTAGPRPAGLARKLQWYVEDVDR